MDVMKAIKPTLTKKSLAIKLSSLKSFENPKQSLEQYTTDSETTALVLWNAYNLGDIRGKTIADIGAGTGILGIGALLLGAKKIYFIEVDVEAVNILKDNLKTLGINKSRINKYKDKYKDRSKNYNIIKEDVRHINLSNLGIDIVLQNPPFGFKKRHMDRFFLQKAFETADVVYSFHNKKTLEFIREYAQKKGFVTTHIFTPKIQLKQTMSYHKSRIRHLDIIVLRFARRSSERV